jgi:ELWxxDGT repeat protein
LQFSQVFAKFDCCFQTDIVFHKNNRLMKVQLAIQIVFFCTIFCKAQAPMLVHDANPDLQPAHCSKVGDEVYFAAWENLSWQPWKSDGTDGGTVRIKDIVGGSAGFDKFVEMNGVAFFYATTPNSGKELWRTDGSPAGTYMIKDINPGSTDGAGGVTPVVFNNRVYFAADNGLQGMELWSTDGTEAGTTFVDVIAGQDGSNPDQLTVLNGVLYFVAEGLSFWSIPNGVIIINDREIFKTDGTAAGTTPVNAPLFDNAYRKPLALTVFQNNLYFTLEVRWRSTWHYPCKKHPSSQWSRGYWPDLRPVSNRQLPLLSG